MTNVVDHGKVSVPVIMVNGAEIPANVELVDVRVRRSLLETSTAVIRVVDVGFTVLDSSTFAVGGALVVKIFGGSTSTTIFEGDIVALGIEQPRLGEMHTTIEAMDRSHRLSAKVVPTTFLNKSSSDIVSAIAGDHGLTTEVTATEKVHDYVLQTVNDRSFITQLAHEVGFEWFVVGDKLTFRPRPEAGTAATTLKWGLADGDPSLISLNARASGVDGAQSVEVHGWDDATSAAIVGSSTASTVDTTAIGSDASLATSAYQSGANDFGGTMVLVPGVLLDQQEATQRAKAITEDLQSSTMRVSGECIGNAVVMPGVWIGLGDCGTKLSGLYYVTEAEHVFGAGVAYVTRFRLSGRRATGLSMNRAASAPPAFGQVGFVIGVVTNVKDDDKKMHRVKVRFPTLPDVESTWARVVTLGGEAASGMEARPEVDDEVLVGFEQGDPRRPFVIGALLSKTDSYRTGTINSDGSINKRGIRTRAGNKLEMFDGDSKSASSGRYIALVGADTATELRLGDENMSLKTKNGNPITIESGQAKITLDNGKITITCNSFELKANQAFKVQGLTVDLKSDTAMGLDAGSTFKAQGQATVTISASGLTEIKGSLLKLN